MPEPHIDWLSCAREALRYFPIEIATVKLISRSENVSFYVEDQYLKRYVLGIHRPEYHTLDELISEQLWTEALLRAGIDVPIVVKTKNGSRYAHIPVGNGERHAGLLAWVEGKSLRELFDDTNERSRLSNMYERVGSLLAHLHLQASAWTPPTEFTRHAFDADGLMGEAPFWGRFWEADDMTVDQKRHMREMRDRLHELLARLPINTVVYSLIHADLHTGNLIYHGDDLHIIDFDDAGFGWHAYDFAVALNDGINAKDRSFMEDALFRGYNRVRRSPAWVRELMRLFSVIRVLVSIGWSDARP